MTNMSRRNMVKYFTLLYLEVQIMGIKGLTDKRDDRSILGRVEVKVFKGDRMSGTGSATRAGKSLDENYRIVTENPHIRRQLEAVYGKADKNGDILTSFINVYFPFDEAQRTFNTAMKAFAGSGLETECDRETITKELELEKDSIGNVHRKMKSCSKQCPVAGEGFSVQCPRGCKPQGELYFYIREIFDAGQMIPCLMTVHSYTDIDYINTRLINLQSEIGSITNSLFPSHQTRHKIPFILTRTKVEIKRPVTNKEGANYLRTGKTAKGEAWAVAINPDSNYIELLQAWRFAQDYQRQAGMSLPQRAIAGLLKGQAQAINYIDAEIVETPQLPSATTTEAVEGDRTITADEWNEARLKLSVHYTKDDILRMVGSYCARPSELMRSQLDEILATLED